MFESFLGVGVQPLDKAGRLFSSLFEVRALLLGFKIFQDGCGVLNKGAEALREIQTWESF